MTGNGPVNLSLLSRGVGEISKNGHEKVDVVFEPEDYFNWANNPDKVYLPPIRRRFPYEAVAEKNRQTFEFGDEKLAHLPKTYTTRKGALLLFSEDLATKTRTTNVRHRTRKLVTHSVDDFDLRTVDDLAKSILSYGKDAENSEIYLGFVHPRKWYRETRRIRPGFSAKRYLSTWTQSWDDSLLHKLLDKGHLTDSSLQQMDPFIPHRRLRLYDDLSHCPAPYRLLRSMLISPGSLAGYTFYRVRPESQQSLPEETELYPGEQQRGDLQIPAHISEGKIKVVQSKHGVMKEVEYKELERQKQEEVLTELLVKSAIHQALKQQQEYVEESIGGSQHGKALSVAGSIVSQGGGKSPLPEFDMKEAVDSLLDSQKGKPLLDGSIISSLGQKSVAESRAPKGRPNSNEVPIDGHFPPPFDTASVTSSRSGKVSLQQATQLPPIEDEGGDLNTYTVLPPIGDIGEGEAEETLGVPMVNIEPPTPQHSTLTNLPQSIRGAMSREPSVSPAKENDTQEEEPGDQWGSNVNESDILAEEKQTSDQRRQSEASEKQSPRGQSVSSTPRSKGPVLAAGSHLQSSRENLAASSSAAKVHLPGTLPGWRASQQSIKSASKHTALQWMYPSFIVGKLPSIYENSANQKDQSEASSPREGSLKGSVVYGPDGEVINVGGAVTLRESPVSVPDINKLLDGAESVLSEDSGHLSDDEGGGDSFRSSSHQLTQRHQKRASREDINAQMSMHSWSYSPKDGDGKSRSSRHSDNQSNASGRSRSSSERVASLAEQGLIDALTEHAQRIAASVLDQNSAGVNLADDIKTAAALWMANHPQTVLSRSQSMQEFPNNTAAQEIARSQKRKSAAPTVAEYKELIRKTLSSAVAHQMGIEDGELPADTEISQDLMEALTNKSLTPDELEVVRTESGRSIIRAKSGRSEATPSPLKDGHLYQPASRKGSHSSTGASPKPPISIPNDRQHTADVGELDVLNLGFAEQEGGATENRSVIGAEGASPALSAKSGKLSDKLSIANGDSTAHSGERSAGSGRSGDSEKSKVSATEAKTPEQELAEIMKELEAKSPGGKSEEGRRKSKSSEKSKKSRNSLDGRDEFVVGKVENKKELEKLYAPLDPPPPKKDTKLPVEGKPKAKKSPSPKKGKKTKKKEKKTDKDSVSSQDVTSSLGDKPPSEVVVVISDKPSPSPSKSESEDFTIREDTEASPSPEPEPAKSLKSAKSAVPSPATLDITDDGDLSDSSSSHPNQISNKDARAAKRAAQAEKRRLEVEKKRKEREEQLKREKEEMDRQEQLNREMEETRRRKAEERRLEKLRREEEADREEAEEIERQKRKQQEAEREKRQREEYQRKLEEHKRKQAELDRQRMEEMLQRQKEEEERRLEEERMLYEMAEHERIAYEKKKKEDAERRKLEEEAARIRREEEAARALEEARKLAEEMARKQAELEARLKFNRGLMLEAKGMGHTQDITRAFVYSYFELLQWLGLDIPEFDMQKLQAKF